MAALRVVRVLALAAGLLAAPLTGGAQPPPAKVPRVGYLSLFPAGADAAQLEAFRQGLRALGHVEGQTVVVETRHADGSAERLPGLAAELVRLGVDVIVAAPTLAVRVAQQATRTRTIPIVMAFGGDPLSEGFVDKLARPGGSVTGLSATATEMAAKRVEFLKAIVPKLSHVMHLTTPGMTRAVVTETEGAGHALGVRVTTTLIRSPGDVTQAFAAMSRGHVGAVIVSLTLSHHWSQIVDLAMKHRLPTVSGPRPFVEAGGLLAAGPDYPDLFRRAATFVDKILKGARPGDLPVEQPTKFEIAVNLRTARALGLTIPASLRALADHVVE